MTEYVYLGDRLTDERLRRQRCRAVPRNGKGIRSKNGSMLVLFEDGRESVISGRRLRKIKTGCFSWGLGK